MTGGRRAGFVVALLALVSVSAAFLACRSLEPTRLTLRFHPFVGAEPLVLGEVRYRNPGGQGLFKVRDFQFYVSNVRLLGDGVEYAVPESYHLARFDGDAGTYEIVIDSVSRGDYRSIELGIGVDPAANGSIDQVGDLDPNGRMAWSWDVGYKFVLLEGGLVLGDTQIPLVYHVGFDENYRTVSFELERSSFDRAEVTLDLCADLLRMFDGPHLVDMAALSNVKFDRDDARLMAENYAGMLSTCPSGEPR